MEECVHYLTKYGTPQQQFDFYTKYDRLSDAITVTFEKKIPPKQFVDKVFAPSMKQNDYSSVLKSMKNLDNSLKQWDVSEHNFSPVFIQEKCIYYSFFFF